MNGFRLTVALLTVSFCGLCEVGCKKASQAPAPKPNSAEALMVKLHEQSQAFKEAMGRKDFRYLHDYGNYFTSLAQALFTRLDEEQKQRLGGAIDELIALSTQLDHAAGGSHTAATEATVQQLETALKELDRQFQPGKKSG